MGNVVFPVSLRRPIWEPHYCSANSLQVTDGRGRRWGQNKSTKRFVCEKVVVRGHCLVTLSITSY